jgi:hypothetical protein
MPDTRKERKRRKAEARRRALESEQARERKRAEDARSKKLYEERTAEESLKRYREKIKESDAEKILSTSSQEASDIWNAIQKTKLGKIIQKESVFDQTYKPIIMRLLTFKNRWKQSPKGWRCRSKNVDRQINSLIDHLFLKYPVPAWAYNLWREEVHHTAGRGQLFMELTDGTNIRKCDHDYVLTKKMAHLVLQAPKECILHEAMRYGQIIGSGCTENMHRALMENEYISTARRGRAIGSHAGVRCGEEFTLSVFEFFSRYPMFDPDQISPVVDYIYAMKYGVDGMEAKENFTLKGRDIMSLMRQTERWHLAINRLERANERARRAAGYYGKDVPKKWHKAYEDWSYGKKPEDGGNNYWEAIVLHTADDLRAEGAAQRHCVGSYSYRCAKGNTSVISFRLNGIRQFTVAVTNNATPMSKPTIIEKRGACNRSITSSEANVLKRWERECKRIFTEEEWKLIRTLES